MNLEIQIQSMVFSFVFGMFFSLMFNLLYKQLFKGYKLIKLLNNFLFINTNVIIYFLLLRIINDGIINYYFIIMLFVGFIIGNKKTNIIRKYRLEVF